MTNSAVINQHPLVTFHQHMVSDSLICSFSSCWQSVTSAANVFLGVNFTIMTSPSMILSAFNSCSYFWFLASSYCNAFLYFLNEEQGLFQYFLHFLSGRSSWFQCWQVIRFWSGYININSHLYFGIIFIYAILTSTIVPNNSWLPNKCCFMKPFFEIIVLLHVLASGTIIGWVYLCCYIMPLQKIGVVLYFMYKICNKDFKPFRFVMYLP